MLARRLLIFAVILLVVSTISASLAPSPSVTEEDSGAGAGATGAGSQLVERSIDAARARPSTIRVREGDTLSLAITAEEPDAVELEGLSVIDAIGPGVPLVLTVFAGRPGDYPVVLVGADRQVATVVVTRRKD